MRRRAGAVGPGLPNQPVKRTKCLKVTSRTVAVRQEPDKYARVVCSLQEGIYVPSDNERVVEGTLWYQLPCGWLCALDNNGYPSTCVANDAEGQRQWAGEFDKRRRVAGAICAMLTRSYSLENARRVAKAVAKHVNTAASSSDGVGGIQMVNLPDVDLDDLMVGLQTASGLRQGEVLEILKVAACQQCNPPRALRDIANDILELMSMRPSMWIKTDRNVLETLDATAKNDQFIMAAARGNTHLFEQFLAIGQELAAVHTELRYTALHAAADFGQDDIARRLIRTGMSVDIRDGRKGQTPLHFAGQSGRSNIARLLLDAGADRTITSFIGLLPYEVAQAQGHHECAEILKFPPPEVQYVSFTNFTTRTISFRWDPPVLDPLINSRVTEFVVEWSPVGNSLVVGHGGKFHVRGTSFTLRHLRPATGHGFVVYSNSLAGVSKPSAKVIQFSKPSPPDRPPAVEMLRVTINGVFLSWQPPQFSNGAKIDRYQLELVESEKGRGIEEEEREAAEAKRRRKEAYIAAKRNKTGLGAGLGGTEEASATGDGGDDDSDFEEEEEEEEQAEEEKDGRWDDEEDALSLTSSLHDEGSVVKPQKIGGGTDISHRIFKVSASTLSKQCMGLEPWKPYQCRVRCHNAMGYSAYSDWIGPVTPQPGVYVLEFDREQRSVRVGWFKPMLTAPRKVTGYQVELCHIMGPVTATLPVFADRADKAYLISKNQSAAWTSVSPQGLSVNELVVADLKAGSKYQLRVRTAIDGQWLDWSMALMSETILMPACAPENPSNLRLLPKSLGGPGAGKSDADEAVGAADGGEESDAVIATGAEEGEADWVSRLLGPPPSSSTAVAAAAAAAAETDSTNKDTNTNTDTDTATGTHTSASASASASASVDDFELTHDSIGLQWTNGLNNGSPVCEFLLEMCKIREYRASDVGKALVAAGATELDEEIAASIGEATEMPTKAKKSSKKGEGGGRLDEETDEDENGDNEEEQAHAQTQAQRQGELQWVACGDKAKLLGPESFLVSGLLPGASYIFRLRTRNEHGWSLASKASPMITTFPCLPVSRPVVVRRLPYSVYIRWSQAAPSPSSSSLTTGDNGDVDSPYLGMTNLEFDVEIGKIPAGETQRTYPVPWAQAEASDAPLYARLDGDPKDSKFVAVLLNNLSPATDYCVRVRVRTVLGWSTWGQVSETFRTLSAPC